MERWHPQAQVDKFDDAGGFLAGPYRGVLHTTEGKSYAGARAAYAAHRSAPHFTVGLEGLWQHVAIDRAARALENASGGVQTNLHSAVQIEVVHYASNPHWPLELINAVRDLMMWVESQTGIRPWSPPFADASAFGLRGVTRMGAHAWKSFDGWCGHQHVPENRHWDPGAINPVMAALLVRTEPEGVDMPDSDAPPIHKAQAPIVAFEPTPDGNGYWIVTADGAVFSFGTAKYLGRVEAPTS